MTQPSVDTAQSGRAADAVRTLQSELSGDYSEMRSAEIALTEAILSAHAVTVSGRAQLQDIQRQLIEAITNPVAALDTPTGERHFLLFLRSKIAEIQAIVDAGALTDEDHARLTRALGSGYLVTEPGGASPPASGAAPAPQADPASGILPAVGSALGSLPQAAQGAATAPAQGAGGLAGAATPLAGLASGLLERGGQESVNDEDDTAEADEETEPENDAEGEDDATEDRVAEQPSTPDDRTQPESRPAPTRPARLM